MKLARLKAMQSVRKIAGVSVPRENATSKNFRKAAGVAAKEPYAGDSSEVMDGDKPRARLDRARRCGGMVKRADGGPVKDEEMTPGQRMKAARIKRDKAASSGVGNAISTVGSMLGAATLAGERLPRVGRLLRAGVRTAIPLGAALTGADMQKTIDANAEIKRLGEGNAVEGEEDRKSGGRVRRAYGGRVKKAAGGSTTDTDTDENRSAYAGASGTGSEKTRTPWFIRDKSKPGSSQGGPSRMKEDAPGAKQFGGDRWNRGGEEGDAEGHKSGGRVNRKGGGWIKEAIRRPGALRKALRVKEGQDIPAKKLENAEHSSSPTLRKRAVLARTLKKMHG